MKNIFKLPLVCMMLLVNGVCFAEIPNAPLNHELNAQMTSVIGDVVDHSGNFKRRYKSIAEVKNVSNLLPLEYEKEIGKEVEDFHKFFFISADETYRKDTNKLVATSVMVGGGGEDKIYNYLTQKYGQPYASYEIHNEFPRGWFSPGRMVVWEDKENVLVLLTDYAHGLRSNVKVMTKDFYSTLDKDSKYFRY